jgi:hypothetical protein
MRRYQQLRYPSTNKLNFVSTIYDDTNNRIIVTIPVNFFTLNGQIVETSDFGNTQLIYDMLQQSWYVHRSYSLGIDDSFTTGIPICDMVIKEGAAYYWGQTDPLNFKLWKKEGQEGTGSAESYLDATDGTSEFQYFVYSFITAAFPTGKAATIEIDGIEPIVATTFGDKNNWQLISDFGKQVSEEQNTNLPINIISKPLINIGISNSTFAQLKLKGITDSIEGGELSTVGFEFYSYNVWFNAGKVASR